MPLAGASLSDSLHDREAGTSPRGTIDDGDNMAVYLHVNSNWPKVEGRISSENNIIPNIRHTFVKK